MGKSSDAATVRPSVEVIKKIEGLLGTGRSDAAVCAHFSLVEARLTTAQVQEVRRAFEGSKTWEAKKTLEKKSLEASGSPVKPHKPLGAGVVLSPASPKAGASPDETSTKMKGGPRNWPREVVEHVQALLQLGWTNGKVANHYSLQEFSLTEAQVELVREMPPPRPTDAGSPGKLAPEDVSRIRALVVEGKTDQAILQHHFFMDRRVTLAHVQAVRAGMRRESGGNTPPSPAVASSASKAAKKPVESAPSSASKIPRKPADLTKQHLSIIRALIQEGRSNAYISNFHALIDLGVLDYQMEQVRRAMDAEADGEALLHHRAVRNASSNSPLPSPVRPANMHHAQQTERERADQEMDLKRQHKERLRAKTADKMRRQRVVP